MTGITIRDVAKQAGVSTATVSRVINGNYYVSPEIEKKVREVIEKLKYLPNSLARSLKNNSSNTIGLLVTDISNSYFTSLGREVEDIVNEQNYNIIMCSTQEDKDRELNYLKLLMGRKLDGLILNTTGKNDDYISSLSKNMPIVLVNRRIYNTDFVGDFIDGSNIDGVYMLTSHLISLGHRKIGAINGDLSVSTGKERFEGFIRAMRQIGVIVDDTYPMRYDGKFTTESGYKGTAYLMGLPDPPTGIVAMNNSIVIGALQFFKTNNVKVPEDVSIVSFGNIDNIDIFYVQPCIVTLNARSVGNRAGNMILDRIKNPSLGNREIIFVPQLIAGNSVCQIL